MREIIFRGKSEYDGEWIHGGALHQTDNYGDEVDRWFIIDGTETNDYDIGEPIRVIPETIGQYTGLTDKNGKKIFEGDIIKTHGNDSYVIKYGEYIPRNYCLARYRDKPTIGFYAYDGERCFQLSTNSRCYEVIGNIHDNPELAEGLL